MFITITFSCSSLTIDKRVSEEGTPITACCISMLMDNEVRSTGVKEVNELIEKWNFFYTNWKSGIKSMEVDQRNEEWLEDPIYFGQYVVALREKKLRSYNSRFKITVNKSIPEVQVIIRLAAYSFHLPVSLQTIWKNNIERIWSNRVKIVSANQEYPVIVKIYWMKDYEEYELNSDGRNRLDCHYFIGTMKTGRSNTADWALDDPYAPAHEIGHYLGNSDEYGIVNGFDYMCLDKENRIKNDCGWSNNIMHTSKNGRSTLANYQLICDSASILLNDKTLYVAWL